MENHSQAYRYHFLPPKYIINGWKFIFENIRGIAPSALAPLSSSPCNLGARPGASPTGAYPIHIRHILSRRSVQIKWHLLISATPVAYLFTVRSNHKSTVRDALVLVVPVPKTLFKTGWFISHRFSAIGGILQNGAIPLIPRCVSLCTAPKPLSIVRYCSDKDM